jgi:periplasmic protein TonB
MNNVSKVSLSIVPASAVTFGLLLFMVALVYTVAPAINVKEPPRLSGIYHTPSPPTTFPKPQKVEKPQHPAMAPERAPATKTTPQGDPVATDMEIGLTKPVLKLDAARIDGDYIPVYVSQPRFPSSALRRGVSGYAIVAVTITTSGAVRNPVLLEESPPGYGFGREAIRAAGKLKYNPRVVDGVAREVPGVPYRFSFVISD